MSGLNESRKDGKMQSVCFIIFTKAVTKRQKKKIKEPYRKIPESISSIAPILDGSFLYTGRHCCCCCYCQYPICKFLWQTGNIMVMASILVLYFPF